MTQEKEAFSDLPPLPEPRTLSRGDEDGTIQLGYTADQMHAYARASLAQPASVPAGWKLVPVEPTDAMGIAGGIAWESSGAMDIIGPLSDAWAAMLAAAPQAPQPAQAKSRQQEIINSIKSALIRHEAATDAVVATAASDDPHAATLAGIELEKAAALLATWAQPEYLRVLLAADPAAPQPAQAVPQLTGCNCRWDGETQVQWCELHAAHKEAIHDWAERAKNAEAKLAAPQPEAQPQWQPIETAPKDGTSVLTYRPHRGSAQITDARYFISANVWGQGSWHYPENNGPTHWMPLPAAPSAQAEQGGK